jgi:hypothetical protein
MLYLINGCVFENPIKSLEAAFEKRVWEATFPNAGSDGIWDTRLEML